MVDILCPLINERCRRIRCEWFSLQRNSCMAVDFIESKIQENLKITPKLHRKLRDENLHPLINSQNDNIVLKLIKDKVITWDIFDLNNIKFYPFVCYDFAKSLGKEIFEVANIINTAENESYIGDYEYFIFLYIIAQIDGKDKSVFYVLDNNGFIISKIIDHDMLILLQTNLLDELSTQVALKLKDSKDIFHNFIERHESNIKEE